MAIRAIEIYLQGCDAVFAFPPLGLFDDRPVPLRWIGWIVSFSCKKFFKKIKIGFIFVKPDDDL